MDRFRQATLAAFVLTPLLLLCGGCNIFGAAGVLASRVIPQKVEAQYKGLPGQAVGVMVWSDRGIRIDWPTIQLDTATAIQNKLIEAQHGKVKELEGTVFPVQPASIARYQAQYPQAQARPITEVAPHLGNKTGLTKLIYIEIEGLSTRPATGVDLFRGSMVGSLKVIDIKDGKATTVYEESDVHAVFPKKAPDEGTPNANDNRIYAGTVDAFTTEVAKHFFTHEMDEE